MNDDSDFHSNTPGIRSWVFVFGAGIVCLLIFVFVSPQHDFSLFAFGSDSDEPELIEDETDKSKLKNKKKRRGKKKKQKKGRKTRSVKKGDDGKLDYVFNDIEFGEVGRESDEKVEEVAPKIQELPPPPKSLWDPSPNYRPSASYSESGRTKKIVSSVDFAGQGASAKGVSPSTIRRRLNTSLVMGCYNQAVNKAPKMRGQVKVKGTIEKDGHISYVKITRSQLRSRVVEKCIVKKIRGVRFPKTGRATMFSTDFSFSSR